MKVDYIIYPDRNRDIYCVMVKHLTIERMNMIAELVRLWIEQDEEAKNNAKEKE